MTKNFLMACILTLTATGAMSQSSPNSSANSKTKDSHELGRIILLLMPRINQNSIPWNHMSDSHIKWLDDGYISQSHPTTNTTLRRGITSVNVLGKKSTVLRKKIHELPWTISLTSQSNPKFGAEIIVIKPGQPNEECFGTLYEGCNFEITPSLTATGIKWKEVCKYSNASEQTYIKGYEIHHPERATAYAEITTNGGSGGSSTSLIIRLPSSTEIPCANN